MSDADVLVVPILLASRSKRDFLIVETGKNIVSLKSRI
jgi:hypothetical protein